MQLVCWEKAYMQCGALNLHNSSHALQLSFDSTKLSRECGQLLFRLLFVFAQPFQSTILLLQLMSQRGDLQVQRLLCTLDLCQLSLHSEWSKIMLYVQSVI